MRDVEVVSFFMANARAEVLSAQRSVFDYFGVPLRQIESGQSHGEFLTGYIRNASQSAEVVVFADIDCVPMARGVVSGLVEIACSSQSVIGCAQQANHLEEIRAIRAHRRNSLIVRKAYASYRLLCKATRRDALRFRNPLIYAAPCFLIIPLSIYNRVGQPTLEPTFRTDAAGELTIACKEAGVDVNLLWPTRCESLCYKLGNDLAYGLGTSYGDLVYHAFETTYRSNEQSTSYFLRACDHILASRSGNVPALDEIQLRSRMRLAPEFECLTAPQS